MNRYSFLVLSSLFLAAPAHADGVLVGHPVDFRIASGTGIVFDTLAVTVDTMTVDFCGTTDVTYDVGATFDIDDPILLPVGEICGISLALTGTTDITGHGTGGGTFALALALAVIQIPVYPSITVTSTSSDGYAIELATPDWVTATDLELATNVHRTVTSASSIHPSLRASVRDDSTILQ